MADKSVVGKYSEMVEYTCSELLEIMDVSILQQAKDVVKGMMGRSVRTKDPLFWPAGMLMLGLVTAAENGADIQAAGEQCIFGDDIRNRALSVLSAHVDKWLRDYDGRISHVDDALAGFSFVRAYQLTGEEKYKAAADKIAQFLITAPRDEQGSIIYNPGRNSSNIFADGIGQVAMFMAIYKAAFYDSEIVASAGTRLDADKQLKNFFEMGVDKKSGLNYHGYSLFDNQRKGLLGWGRAFGWLFMGVAQTARAIVVMGDDESVMNSGLNITGLYRQMCRTAIEYQRPDGGWSWQLQAIDGHIDMSATGMIAYSLAVGCEAGIIDDATIIKALELAESCMLQHIIDGKVQDALSSCDDFGVHYQTYGHYPWGQGAVLAALTQIMKTKALKPET